jgi:hypothetical protein
MGPSTASTRLYQKFHICEQIQPPTKYLFIDIYAWSMVATMVCELSVLSSIYILANIMLS